MGMVFNLFRSSLWWTGTLCIDLVTLKGNGNASLSYKNGHVMLMCDTLCRIGRHHVSPVIEIVVWNYMQCNKCNPCFTCIYIYRLLKNICKILQVYLHICLYHPNLNWYKPSICQPGNCSIYIITYTYTCKNIHLLNIKLF